MRLVQEAFLTNRQATSPSFTSTEVTAIALLPRSSAREGTIPFNMVDHLGLEPRTYR